MFACPWCLEPVLQLCAVELRQVVAGTAAARTLPLLDVLRDGSPCWWCRWCHQGGLLVVLSAAGRPA